jgi:Domain of unknown function (DUF4105)
VNNSKFISVSVEARKVEGEEYSPFKGLVNKYNLLYMIVDEKDITTLRTVVREDDLFSYKLKMKLLAASCTLRRGIFMC